MLWVTCLGNHAHDGVRSRCHGGPHQPKAVSESLALRLSSLIVVTPLASAELRKMYLVPFSWSKFIYYKVLLPVGGERAWLPAGDCRLWDRRPPLQPSLWPPLWPPPRPRIPLCSWDFLAGPGSILFKREPRPFWKQFCTGSVSQELGTPFFLNHNFAKIFELLRNLKGGHPQQFLRQRDNATVSYRAKGDSCHAVVTPEKSLDWTLV